MYFLSRFGYHGDDFSNSEIPKGDLFMLYSLTTATPAAHGDPVVAGIMPGTTMPVNALFFTRIDVQKRALLRQRPAFFIQ
jgi:hypothetical protein